MRGRHRVIRTARLELVSMSSQLMAALRDGRFEEADLELGIPLPSEWRTADWAWIKRLPEEVEAAPEIIPWLPHVSVACSEGEQPRLVGEVGFHGPPKQGEVEIGYMTVTAEQGRGYATEGAGGLIEWAAKSGVTQVRASISSSNRASQTVAAKLGFEEDGRYIHPERGEEVMWRRHLPAGDGRAR